MGSSRAWIHSPNGLAPVSKLTLHCLSLSWTLSTEASKQEHGGRVEFGLLDLFLRSWRCFTSPKVFVISKEGWSELDYQEVWVGLRQMVLQVAGLLWVQPPAGSYQRLENWPLLPPWLDSGFSVGLGGLDRQMFPRHSTAANHRSIRRWWVRCEAQFNIHCDNQ